MDVPRAEFETTIDEIVDANHKLARQTKTYWRQVHVSQASAGIAFAVAVLASVLTKLRCDCLSSQAIALIVSIAIAGGALIAYLYRHVHVWLFRRSTRRMFVEMMHGDGPIRCVMELRENQLSCKSKHSEVSLPWSPATRIVDAADAIEMWFDPGLAVVPNRAFRTADDRVAFLSAAHRLAAAPR